MEKTAVVGAGLIGRAWAIVFARAGFEVALWDPAPGAVEAAIRFAAERLPELQEAGLLREGPEAILARMRQAATLEAAVDGAAWVQESGPERAADKRALFAALDRAAPPDAILASSTSFIPASEIAAGLPGAARCLIAHPVNPPYLVPVVELAPAPFTAPDTVARARDFMRRAGMVPATVNKEVRGFLLNRLQAALLAEAFRLVEDGVATPEDIDATVRDGLGLRWSFMGPFETIDLNAPGGLRDYCDRYGPTYAQLQQEMAPRAWTKELVDRLDGDQRGRLPMARHAARQEWRDRRLIALLAHRAKQPR